MITSVMANAFHRTTHAMKLALTQTISFSMKLAFTKPKKEFGVATKNTRGGKSRAMALVEDLISFRAFIVLEAEMQCLQLILIGNARMKVNVFHPMSFVTFQSLHMVDLANVTTTATNQENFVIILIIMAST